MNGSVNEEWRDMPRALARITMCGRVFADDLAALGVGRALARRLNVTDRELRRLVAAGEVSPADVLAVWNEKGAPS